MADAMQKSEKHLTEITECPICMSAFTDPRVLPCIHTFCFECLKRTAEGAQMKPRDKMPCPLCRKEFIIPADGMNGVQKNFFMENLLESKTTLQFGSTYTHCCQCKIRNKGKTGNISKATKICLECKYNYCDSCSKDHQKQKMNRNHHLLKIESEIKEEPRRIPTVKSCTKHIQKLLDYYCADCKIIVCVSCFVESHKAHDCKDITTVDGKFRQMIEQNASKISNYTGEMLLKRKDTETVKGDFLKKMIEMENTIRERNHELKAMVDKHTISLLDELSLIKSNHLKVLEKDLVETDRCCTVLRSFEAYCTELRLKASATDICISVDKLIARADDIEGDCKALIDRRYVPVEISFQRTDFKEVLLKSNNNMVGKIQEFKNYAVVVGINDATDVFAEYPNDEAVMTNDVIKINLGSLHQSNDISTQEQIGLPTEMSDEAFAAVYCNTMYVAGIGTKRDEIWKYNMVSGWMKCASLVQGRRRHSAAFFGEILYICGGFVLLDESVLDSVETYNAVTDECCTVGKLVHGVHNAGNCVPFRSSLYIFGGIDKFGSLYVGEEESDDNDIVNQVQVYNTKQNTCTLLSKPMPCRHRLMRTVLWETSVILLGYYNCFIFNFETETWHERNQFKTDVHHFGLVLDNDRIFVIGGGTQGYYHRDGETWKCRDDVRYVPLQNILDDKPVEWKIYGKLPQRSLIHAYEKLTVFVP